ncbi:MAG: TonB-dependent receptor plug domain-containing protein, partial [Gemmatimonadaceae bacterium]|nr:TonB-dependent receptor plug domain-containing protein [Gemmatimonadaceae bacterium]
MPFAFSGVRVVRRFACVACLPVVSLAQQSATPAVVADVHSRVPLAGVVLEGAGLHLHSDANGRLSIPVADGAQLILRRAGYRPLALRDAAPGDTIFLTPEPTLLNTVTVESPAVRNMLATGTTQPVGSVSRTQLDAVAAPSLADALKGIEGINVQRPGAWGSKAFVRGLGGERVAVLIDGQRVNRACTFGMDQGLATVDPATVERVELLSGPGSTLYGSGNVGGVINVVTRPVSPSARRGGEVRAATSSAVPGASAGATVSTGGRQADVVFSADVASYGDYRAPTGTVNESGLRTLSLDAKAGIQPTAATRLSLQGAAYEGRDIGYPGSMGATIPRESRYSGAVEWGAQLSRGVLDAVSARVFAQRLEHDMSVQMAMMMNNMKVTQVTDARSHSLTSGVRTQLRLVPASASSVDVGMEAVEWRAEATRVTQRVSTLAPA